MNFPKKLAKTIIIIGVVSGVLIFGGEAILKTIDDVGDRIIASLVASEESIIESPAPSTSPTPATSCRPAATVAPSPSSSRTPLKETTGTISHKPSYCGFWVTVSSSCANYNHVGSDWTLRYYASFDGVNYIEIPSTGLWLDVSSPKTLYIKTYICEYDDAYPDSYTNEYNTYLDFDTKTDGSGTKWTITQETKIVENNGTYRGNSCLWETLWEITLLYS